MCYGHVDNELMTCAKDECKRNIVDHFPMEDEVDVTPHQDMMTALAKYQQCTRCGGKRMQFEHSLRGWNLRCMECQEPWPRRPVQLLESDFPKLFTVLHQLNLSIGTVNINNTQVNNYITNVDEPFVGTYDEDGLVVFEDAGRNAEFLTALRGTDAPLSRFIFAMFRDEFHCCKSGAKGVDGLWYQFRDHHWMPKAELTLRTRLGGEEFLKYFRRALQFYERECIQTEDTKRKARHIKRLFEQLEDGGRRKRILEDAIELFHEHRPDFAEKLDTGNMLVFTNGVYDFNTFEFRDGRPEDLLSVALKIPYTPVDWESADSLFVMDFMAAIQPEQETRDYLLTVLSLCLTTDTTMQHFWIFTGTGANGKSKLMNFLMDTLGDYYGTAPAALLTRRREDANQANESLSALEKARVAVFSEGSAAEVLQVNTIKLFTGEDAITTRGLHEKQRRWKPSFKCTMTCNDPPLLDENTWAAWRRMKLIPFSTLFVDNPRRPHERQKDPSIGEKLSACTAAFIAILVEYYRRYKTQGLREPTAVTAATQKYQTDNDVFEEFKEEHLMEEEGSAVSVKAMYSAFQRWAQTKRRVIPPKTSAQKALFEKHLGKVGNHRFGSQPSDTLYGWKNVKIV